MLQWPLSTIVLVFCGFLWYRTPFRPNRSDCPANQQFAGIRSNDQQITLGQLESIEFFVCHDYNFNVIDVNSTFCCVGNLEDWDAFDVVGTFL